MGLNILWHFLPMGTISSHVQLGPSTTIKMALMRTQKLTICETITLVLIAQCCCFGFCRKKWELFMWIIWEIKLSMYFVAKVGTHSVEKTQIYSHEKWFHKVGFAYQKCRSRIQYFPHCGWRRAEIAQHAKFLFATFSLKYFLSIW